MMKLKNISDLLLSILDKNSELADSQIDVDYYKSKHDVVLGGMQ